MGGKKERKDDTDMDISREEPLCAAFDYGVDPVEVIQNSIYKSNNYLMNGRHRYDSEEIYDSRAVGVFVDQIRDFDFVITECVCLSGGKATGTGF